MSVAGSPASAADRNEESAIRVSWRLSDRKYWKTTVDDYRERRNVSRIRDRCASAVSRALTDRLRD